jgi:transposase
MSEITTIGLDLAKHVFQVHGIDAQGTTVLRKRLRRGQVLAFFQFRYYAMGVGLMSGGLGMIGIGQGPRLLLLILGKG